MSDADKNDTKHNSIKTYSCSKQFETTNSLNLISLISWNIIHKDFVDPEEGYGAYTTSDDLEWTKRCPKIKTKLSSSNADIICLQEVDKHSFSTEIGNEFQKRYNYTFKVNNPKKHNVDFTIAIMFKASKFECKYEDHRSRAMILLLTNTLEQKNCLKCINSRNICLYHSFFIVTVHLDSPRNGKNNELTRINQIKSVLKRINYALTEKLKVNVCRERKNVRIIIVGDFNTGHKAETAQMILTDNNPHFKHKYKFNDAYYDAISWRKFGCNDYNVRIKYFPTYCANQYMSSIDLLFYSNNIKLKGVIETLPNDVKEEIKWNQIIEQRIHNEWKYTEKKSEFYDHERYNDLLLLPNQKFPSDHLPIGAVFELNSLCDVENKNSNKCCQCCDRTAAKRNQTKKKKRNTNKEQWIFHEINSF